MSIASRPPTASRRFPATYDKVKPPALVRRCRAILVLRFCARSVASAPRPPMARTPRKPRAPIKCMWHNSPSKRRKGGVFFQVASNDHGVAGVLAGLGGPQAGTGDGAGAAPDRLTLDPARDQNAQGRKLDFVNQQDSRAIYNLMPSKIPCRRSK